MSTAKKSKQTMRRAEIERLHRERAEIETIHRECMNARTPESETFVDEIGCAICIIRDLLEASIDAISEEYRSCLGRYIDDIEAINVRLASYLNKRDELEKARAR